MLPRERPRQGTHVRKDLEMTETQNAIGDWEIWQNIMEWEWEKRATDKPACQGRQGRSGEQRVETLHHPPCDPAV
jgi:hypothetical protein